MTQYASRTDLGRLGVAASAISSVADADVDAALVASSVTADGYLQTAGYRLPLSAWGEDLRRVVCHLAAYDLVVTKASGPQDNADEHLRLRQQDAVRWLERVADRRIVPVGLVDAGATDFESDLGTPEAISDEARGW